MGRQVQLTPTPSRCAQHLLTGISQQHLYLSRPDTGGRGTTPRPPAAGISKLFQRRRVFNAGELGPSGTTARLTDSNGRPKSPDVGHVSQMLPFTDCLELFAGALTPIENVSHQDRKGGRGRNNLLMPPSGDEGFFLTRLIEG